LSLGFEVSREALSTTCADLARQTGVDVLGMLDYATTTLSAPSELATLTPEIAEDYAEDVESASMSRASAATSKLRTISVANEATRGTTFGVAASSESVVESLSPTTLGEAGFWESLFSPGFEPVSYEHKWDPATFSGVGDPIGEAEFWRLQTGNSCAVNAQICVIESMTGESIPEAVACDWLEERGWYDPDRGTSPSDMARLMDARGIESELSRHNEILDLAAALEEGERVIVALNANEIWTPLRHPVTGEVISQSEPGGHAVWITGIDQHHDGSFSVIMNDTGHTDGRMQAVALEDFMEAWADYDNLMVAVKAPTC